MIISEKKSPIWRTKSLKHHQQQQHQQQHQQSNTILTNGTINNNYNLSNSKTSLLSTSSSTDDLLNSTSSNLLSPILSATSSQNLTTTTNNTVTSTTVTNHIQNSPIATTYLPGLSSYNNNNNNKTTISTTSLHYNNELVNDNNLDINKHQHKQLLSGTSSKQQQSNFNEEEKISKIKLNSKSSTSSSQSTTVASPSSLLLSYDDPQQNTPLLEQNHDLTITSEKITQGETKLKNFKNTKDITSILIDDKNNINNNNSNSNNHNNSNDHHIECHSSTLKLSTKKFNGTTAITQKSLISNSSSYQKHNNNFNDNSSDNNNDNTTTISNRNINNDYDNYYNNDDDDDDNDIDNLSTKNLISMDYNSNNQYNKNNSNSKIYNNNKIHTNSILSTNTITSGFSNNNNNNSGNSNNNKKLNDNNENNNSNSNIINNNNSNGSYGNGKIYNSINNSNLYNSNFNINSDNSNNTNINSNINNNINSNSNSTNNSSNSSSGGDDDDNRNFQKQKYHYSYHTFGNNNSSTTYLARCCLRFPLLKSINVKRCVLGLLVVTLVTIFYYTHYVDNGVFVGLIHRDTRPAPLIHCRMLNGGNNKQIVSAQTPDHRSEARLRIDPKVLVFVETTYSRLGRDIAELLVYNRIKYKIEVAGKSLPVLTNLDKGRYGVIVFENLDKYLHMDKWNRELLDKYCREYSVGIVGFVSPSEETLVAAQLRGFPVYIHTNLRLRDASLNPASSVLRLTRAGDTAWGLLPGDDWAIFQHNHSTYEPIEWAQRNTQEYLTDGIGQVQPPLATVLQDHGQFDGIQRIFFGSSLRFWLHRLLFLDALSYLSHGQLSLSLNRMILVDIDDIFVGEKGTRLRPDDVLALIATQKRIAEMVPGFRFNLGFSGKYYHHGTHEENLGDDLLLRNIGEFNWFSHMWNHQQPHLYENLTILMNEMLQNYGFAKDHGIPTDSSYSVSPHHSGVYPAHELLYTAWKKVWNIKVTSTEEYPHLRPARLRRGFIHRNIMVLPRQTCGLFTHTMYIDRYPGGRDKLDESIQGGELFQTIVYNPINIFMTHMSNYGSDRLALYTFESVIKFLRCWTNLKLSSAPPLQLGETYFRLHPEESDPVWGNPCEDPRHLKIWSKQKDCDSLPKFLVIGPQKTGTTALYTFLSMHPSIASNIPSPDTFEEIQFFNGNNYYRGLDWYMTFFPTTSNTTTKYMFEKSATYFDGDLVPRRSHALLPHAKIVTILISPAKRAYSWYQHTKAHGDLIANNYSFYQVITASDTAPKALKDLRNRCLNPGKYAQHLERWLAYYPAQQLHIIDGEQLKSNPIDVMNELQRFLKIQPPYDYSKHLRFDNKKGFYCQVVNDNRNKCLGKSKGRQYPPMDDRSLKLLQRFYLSHNTALVKLLKKLGSRPIPQWLKDDLSTTS